MIELIELCTPATQGEEQRRRRRKGEDTCGCIHELRGKRGALFEGSGNKGCNIQHVDEADEAAMALVENGHSNQIVRF